jgi:hypothetical protein
VQDKLVQGIRHEMDIFLKEMNIFLEGYTIKSVFSLPVHALMPKFGDCASFYENKLLILKFVPKTASEFYPAS